MNAIPLVLALLIAWAALLAGGGALDRSLLCCSHEQSAYNRCLWQALGRAARKSYDNKKALPNLENEETAPKPKPELEPKKKENPRLHKAFREAGGINLRAWLERKDSPGRRELGEQLAAWIDTLYSQSTFYYAGIGRELLATLEHAYAKYPEAASLKELLLLPQFYQEPFYKMLLGSTTFDKQPDQLLCPPLERVLFFDSGNSLFIWKSAHPSLIEALLGKESAEQIFHLEERSRGEGKHLHLSDLKGECSLDPVLSATLQQLSEWCKESTSSSVSLEELDPTGIRLTP